jgi:hypothetical protein
MRDQLAKGTDEERIKKMSYMLLPRKKRELYKAMQLGIAKKEKRAAELTRLAEEHKEKKRLQEEGKDKEVSAPKASEKGAQGVKRSDSCRPVSMHSLAFMSSETRGVNFYKAIIGTY